MELAILNVGSGDTKITFDKSNPEERERAKRIVQDMLKRGYAILVQAGEKDGKPIFYRATGFDPETCEYIIAGVPDDLHVEPEPRAREKRVPAEKARAVGVARSAGGMSRAANSIEAENRRKLDNMRAHDGMTGLRQALSDIAAQKKEWAGIPMPLEGEQLIVEPRYPYAKELMAMTKKPKPTEAAERLGFKIRNRFFSTFLRSDVCIIEDSVTGKINFGVLPGIHSIPLQMQTLGASDAWGVEQEARALQLLGTLLDHRRFKQYLMTGSFIETSRRSGVVYLFRKLRPTVAMRPDDASGRIIAALCMHPIAYYDGSWGGSMCPTDDVIAHLMLMRGDERLYWRRCNQHPPHRPEAGL